MRTLLLSSLLLLAAVGCSDLDGASPTEGAGGTGANGGGTGGSGSDGGGGSSLRDCTTALQCLPGEDCVGGRCERIAGGGGGEGGSGTGTGGSGTGGSGTGGSGTGTGGSGTGGSGTGGSGVVDVPCARSETLCDGADDDCNGQVDEICSCSGASQECFLGPAGARGVGACTTGRQLCAGEFWAECVGSIGPRREVCNGLDDDCDGVVDDGVQPCGNEPPNAICPPDMTTTPLRTVPLAGNGNDPDGRIVSWRWDIIAKPLGSASVANPAAAQRSEVFLDIAGGYTARLTVTDDGGASDTCDVDINAVPTERFRVEMLWNFGVANDSSDVDLHLLHPSAGTTDWFNSSWDCYYANCVGGLGGWGNQGQTPRLDLDDVQGNGPENINIDQPAPNTAYTVGVHYYDNDGMGDANVIVKIWCEGAIVKEFEGVSLSASGANSANNDIWRVADVTFAPAGGCTLREYGSQGARDVRSSSSW